MMGGKPIVFRGGCGLDALWGPMAGWTWLEQTHAAVTVFGTAFFVFIRRPE